jgi:hypothetical protein
LIFKNKGLLELSYYLGSFFSITISNYSVGGNSSSKTVSQKSNIRDETQILSATSQMKHHQNFEKSTRNPETDGTQILERNVADDEPVSENNH